MRDLRSCRRFSIELLSRYITPVSASCSTFNVLLRHGVIIILAESLYALRINFPQLSTLDLKNLIHPIFLELDACLTPPGESFHLGSGLKRCLELADFFGGGGVAGGGGGGGGGGDR